MLRACRALLPRPALPDFFRWVVAVLGSHPVLNDMPRRAFRLEAESVFPSESAIEKLKF